jgi:hypothetical protein
MEKRHRSGAVFVRCNAYDINGRKAAPVQASALALARTAAYVVGF